MKQVFKTIAFRKASYEKIDQANEIIDEYISKGFKLTLRQLYYQFVARDLLPNTKTAYDNLGGLISNARLAGLIDWSAIEDRTRFLRGRTNWGSPAEMIEYRAETYSIDMWKNQTVRLEVWIEKDALVGVIEKVCSNNDIDYFACRGYVSQSELYAAGRRFKRYRQQGYNPIMLHLGDHDPSGIDMTRDNNSRLDLFSTYGIEVERLALNMDQIDLYNPPPNPAKMTDSRFQQYSEEYGNESWELDALNPEVIAQLIQDRVDHYKDQAKWEIKERQLIKHKMLLDKAVDFIGNREDDGY